MTEVKAGNDKAKTKRLVLAAAIVLTLVFLAAVGLRIYATDQISIFKYVEYGSDYQNNKVLVASDLDMIYLGTYKNIVRAFDLKGELRWEQSINGAIQAMQYDDELKWLIVGSQDRNVYVYDAVSGDSIASYNVNGLVYDMDYEQKTGRLLVSSKVSASKQTIYVYDIKTGEELFKYALKQESQGTRYSSDYSAFYYGDARGRLFKVDFEGNQLAKNQAKTEIVSMAVAPGAGEVYVLDKNNYLFKFDKDLNEIWNIQLVGRGKYAGVSEDGRWVAVGTEDDDVYILDSDAKVHFTTRLNADVTQIYFDADVSYVVTQSTEFFEFFTSKLERINMWSNLHKYSLIAAIALFALTFAAYTYSFRRSRACAKRFFSAIYKHHVAYLMLLPSIGLILVFNYYNVIQAFYYAFTDWDLATRSMREIKLIGFDNFVRIFEEQYFIVGVKNLVIMMVASFIKLLTVPLLLAELVFAMRTKTGESSRRRYWFRLLLVMPMVVPGVVSALMWKNIYDPNIGALNSMLNSVGLSEWTRSWLGNSKTALGAIIFMGFPWVNSFAFLVYYGGLINIPGDLFEAAKVDGSSPAWNFFHIHLPLISPQLKMLIITTFIGSVQDYGGVYLLTEGGPGVSTYVPGLELYYAATRHGKFGYACAMGVLMFIVILIGSLFNMRMKTQELN